MEYDEILVVVEIPTAHTQEEKKWGVTVGMKAYSKGTDIINRIFIPIYNRVWKVVAKSGDMTDHPNYEKGYFAITACIFNLIGLAFGALDIRNHRYLHVASDYWMEPRSDGLYEINDIFKIIHW